MTDERLEALLGRMEGWLSEADHEFLPEELEGWNRELADIKAALGPGWQGLEERARVAKKALGERLEKLMAERDVVKAELDGFARGGRALKGYGISSR